jgi:hypothetical protein
MISQASLDTILIYDIGDGEQDPSKNILGR